MVHMTDFVDAEAPGNRLENLVNHRDQNNMEQVHGGS